MASVQCYKTCQETCQQQKTQSSLSCQQKTHHGQSSFGHKVSDMFKGHHNGATATQTHANSQCHSQCRGANHHSACSYVHTHTQQGYGAANHHNNGPHHGASHQNGCSKSHTHTQSCGGANHHHNNGGHHGGSHHHNGGGYGMTTKSSETDYFHSETKTTTANRCSNGTSKKEHKSGGMFQKIKNGLSGHSDSSSSDSESDSDNENKCRSRRSSRKACSFSI
ncbi:hypothetical protein PIB30_112620 [Stylosanthes scabra]|uniref:Uncharacterized protein n=1 Tax=Stylosanthes scabra TaxID=79078 RepID=A0ABU6V0F2_9FABA|nr:hypothetical protein [Stylosanthes scabra]